MGDFRSRTKKRFGLPPKPFLNILNSIAKKNAKADFSGHKPIDAVRNISIPILYIHGLADDFVPFEMSQELYEQTKSDKEFIKSKDAGHAECHYALGENYYSKIDKFVKQYI